MGWSSGTSIFDDTVAAVLDDDSTPEKVIAALFVAMEEHDWDVFCESEFYNHPRVRAAVRMVIPDYDFGDDE